MRCAECDREINDPTAFFGRVLCPACRDLARDLMTDGKDVVMEARKPGLQPRG
jgi:hypothetical protein